MSDVGDSRADEPVGRELVPVARDEVVEARPVDDGALPVVAERASLPATVAAASGGFLLGVAAFMLVRVLRRPAAARRVTGRRGRLLARRRGVEVASSRSFLVDVHLLKR
ncbi:MAG: hypothetical protein WD993_06550 [Thermoleophilaceae bacterium]